MGSITSINLTYRFVDGSVGTMDGENRTTEADREPSPQECECPEPCNCDHENE